MSRQVISYDDLTPLGTSSQTTLPSFASASVTESKHPTVADFGSPTSKKRRRYEDDTADSATGNNGKRVGNGLGNDETTAKNGSNWSSFDGTLPPKPQVKKRGRNWRRSAAGSNTNAATAFAPHVAIQHWDDPGTQADGISYDEGTSKVNVAVNDLDESNWEIDENGGAAVVDEDEEDEEDESRELTHEEIWDDSALIAAWDAANEEYEAIHGKTKRWKKDRVHKSPLWYNIPPEKPILSKEGKGKAKRNTNGVSSAAAAEERPHEASGVQDSEANSSVPLNFETYVPTHDPSLAITNPQQPPPVPEPTQVHLKGITTHYSSMLSGSAFNGVGDASASVGVTSSGAAGVSVDEAFSRALGAMYWCGYWTAVYHVQKTHEQGSTIAVNVEPDSSSEAQETEAASELVSTQR